MLFAPRPPHRLIEEPAGWNLQRLGNLLQHDHGGIAHTAFDTAHIGTVQAAFEGQPFLAEPQFLADILHIEADPPAHIHGASGARMYTTDLQTMSLILLDFVGPTSDHHGPAWQGADLCWSC